LGVVDGGTTARGEGFFWAMNGRLQRGKKADNVQKHKKKKKKNKRG